MSGTFRRVGATRKSGGDHCGRPRFHLMGRSPCNSEIASACSSQAVLNAAYKVLSNVDDLGHSRQDIGPIALARVVSATVNNATNPATTSQRFLMPRILFEAQVFSIIQVAASRHCPTGRRRVRCGNGYVRMVIAPVAQWIECWPPEPETGVRVSAGVLALMPTAGRNAGASGCGLVARRLLWEQEIGSSNLPTPTKFRR